MTPAEKTDEGFLRADAFLSRSGVFEYTLPDGSQRREYRPAEEVFHKDSLSSFSLAPMTLGHPSAMVTSKTAKSVGVGTVGEDVRRDGDKIASKVLVTDERAIAFVGAAAKQLSCGYRCDIEDTSGVSPEGEAYDVIQRNIRGNHVAIVTHGRAGPEVRLRLDAADQVDAIDGEKETPMKTKTIRIDSIDFTFPEDNASVVE